MRKRAYNPNFVNIALQILGFSLSVLPPAICTLAYFPLWREAGGATALSGGVALLLVLSALPLLKAALKHMRTPSAPALWLFVFALFFCLSKIADQMAVISLCGLFGNLLGSICFKIAKLRKPQAVTQVK